MSDRQGSLKRFPLYSEQTFQNLKCFILHRASFQKTKQNKTAPFVSLFPSFNCFFYFSLSSFLCMQVIWTGQGTFAQLEIIHRCFGIWAKDSHESLIQLFHSHFCCASCSNKVCQNVQHKSLSSSPFGLFLQLRGIFLFTSLSASGFSCLSRWRTIEEVIITVTVCRKKQLWHLIYFCPLSVFSVSCLYKKVCFFF